MSDPTSPTTSEPPGTLARVIDGFPERRDDLSARWFEQILDAEPGSLDGCDLAPIGEGGWAELTRVRLRWRPGALQRPAAVIVKLTSPDAIRDQAWRGALAGREVRFYRDLAAHLALRTPRIHHAAAHRTGRATVVVMEDLGRLAPSRPGTTPLTMVETLVSTVAPMHARWWDAAELDPLDWLLDGDQPGRLGWVRGAVPGALDWFATHAPPLEPLVSLLPDAIDAGIDRRRGPRTLVHGDLGARNLAIVDGRPVLFDWQLAGRESPAVDLVEAIDDADDALPRDELVPHLVSLHQRSLTAAGIDATGHDDFLVDLARTIALRSLVTPLRVLRTPDPDPRPPVLRTARQRSAPRAPASSTSGTCCGAERPGRPPRSAQHDLRDGGAASRDRGRPRSTWLSGCPPRRPAGRGSARAARRGRSRRRRSRGTAAIASSRLPSKKRSWMRYASASYPIRAISLVW